MVANRAQGTIEYLVIIAIVVVIALVVVGLLLQVMGSSGSGVPETTAKTTWKATEPWAIIDWSNDTSNGVIVVLKNTSFETLGLNYIQIGSAASDKNSSSAIVASGGTVVRTLPSATNKCATSGTKYVIPQNGISIDYNTTNLSHKKELGVADIVGTCS